MNIFYFLTLLLSILVPCNLQSATPTISRPEMTIFIHGSMQPAEWSIKDLIKVIRDKIENSIYVKAGEYLRQDPYFFRGQAMQEEGLHPIDLNNQTSASSILARMCEKQFNWLENTGTPRLYYTFGWKGIVHLYTRYEDAKILYQQLVAELKELAIQGIHPKIRLVTYSHGGNVALNLAAVKDDDPALTDNFVIDELIMFATPIQPATDYLVARPMFKRVYHFFSWNDSIQTLDFTCPKQFFSKRKFKNHRTFTIPSSLIQIRFRTTKALRPKMKKWAINNLNYTFLTDKRFRHVCEDPLHTEFWNFQWGSRKFRSSFPLAPLPVVAFFPTLIATIEQTYPKAADIIFEFAPAYEGAVIKNEKTGKRIAVKTLTHDRLNELIEISKASGKTICNPQEQQQHLKDALEKAEDDFEEEHHEKISQKHTTRLAHIMT